MFATPRRIASVLAVGAFALTVAACDKPDPDVTFQSGSKSVVIEQGKNGRIEAKPGSTLLVDVPKDVADGYWLAKSFVVDSSNKPTEMQLDGAGSPVLHDTHATRLVVPSIANLSYVVLVGETDKAGQGKAGKQWQVVVNIRN
jgi:hypothetical protein